jgi:hypothetical protein
MNNKIIENFNPLDSIKGLFGKIFSPIGKFIGDIIRKIFGVIGNIFGKIRDTILNILKEFRPLVISIGILLLVLVTGMYLFKSGYFNIDSYFSKAEEYIDEFAGDEYGDEYGYEYY